MGTTGFGVVYANFGFIASAILAAALTLVSALSGMWRGAKPLPLSSRTPNNE
jgi:hypothetical protein